jgi:uncharacterized protein (TIGR04255 family)
VTIAPKHLSRAPAVEAALVLDVGPPPGFDFRLLSGLQQKFGETYPNITDVHLMSSFVQLVPGQPTANASGVQIGYRFSSKDGLHLAQVRPDGLLFSRLHPYTSWDEFKKEAQRIWEPFRDLVSPRSVKRLGLRFINRLSFPKPFDYNDYLRAPPVVPEGLPQFISGFLTQVMIEDPDNKVSSVLIQVSQPSIDPAFGVVILDISSFKQGDFDLDEGKMWSMFDLLRDTKNRIFFNSITEKTLRMIE